MESGFDIISSDGSSFVYHAPLLEMHPTFHFFTQPNATTTVQVSMQLKAAHTAFNKCTSLSPIQCAQSNETQFNITT